MSTNNDPNAALHEAATKALNALRQVATDPLTVEELAAALDRINALALPVADSLKCPHCQYAGEVETDNGGTFRYLVSTTAWREIVESKKSRRKTKPQTIIVDGLSHTYDEDEETNDRIECRKCMKEFLLAKSIEVEFV